LSNDLERPLGRNLNRGKRSGLGSGRIVLYGVLLGSVLAVSTVFALQGKSFRSPQLEAEKPIVSASANLPSEEVVVEKAATEANEKLASKAPESKGSGPKIIKVRPDDSDVTGGIKVRDPSSMTQDARVAHVPDPALIEKTSAGNLPIRAEDGRRPLDVYARPWSGKRGARVAIIIGGLGISQTATQRAIRSLPPEVTLAFAPQGNSLLRWAQSARRDGHEILLQMPMEPFDYPAVNPGRGTLLADADPEQNLEELRNAMSRISNFTGVLNYMGAKFTSEPAALQPVLNEIAGRGLMFVDDGTSARSQAAVLMKEAKGAYATGDFVIDDVQDRNEIMKKLDQLEVSARASGSAIATGTAFDPTIDAVAVWAEEAKKRGVEIVGVSALANDPEK
jgi:uncharacterized protein